MNLPIPQVGNEPGPQYAQDINNCLTLVDQHNHSPGYGTRINPNGIDINSDLAMNTNNLTTARSVRFIPQNNPLVLATDIGCLYEVVNDLYYNDGLGNNIRLTQSGSVAGTNGSIANLVPPASVTYVSLSQTVVFQSAANVAANVDVRNVVLRTNAVSSPGLTLSAPPAISSDYSLQLPPLPVSMLPMMLDSSGNMSTGQITTGLIVNNAITTPLINNGAVTRAKLEAVGQQISASCGAFNPGNGFIGLIPNFSLPLTTTGRPVVISCQPAQGTTSGARILGSGSFGLLIYRDATLLSMVNYTSGLSYPPSIVTYLDTPSAGTYTYSVQVNVNVGLSVLDLVFVVYEL